MIKGRSFPGAAFFFFLFQQLGFDMPRTFVFVLSWFVSCAVFAASAHAADYFDATKLENVTLQMDAGFRRDQLDWNIAGNLDGENPNILSELSWEGVDIFQIHANSRLEISGLPYLKRFEKNALLIADVAIGKVFNGEVQDSDYAGDDRSLEWSRSDNGSDKGVTVDLSGAFGPVFRSPRFNKLTLTPLVGYAFNMQGLYMTDGQQTTSEPSIRTLYFGSDASLPPEVGPIPGLNSSYTAYWYGPWIGLQADYEVNDRIRLEGALEYHWIEYFAQADWNLRSDFDHPVSFEHEAKGSGVVWNFKGTYALDEQWSALLRLEFQRWQTDSGTDRTYFSDGGVGVARLNEVNWDSFAFGAGVEYRF